jgi:hypothetical protein
LKLTVRGLAVDPVRVKLKIMLVAPVLTTAVGEAVNVISASAGGGVGKIVTVIGSPGPEGSAGQSGVM